jgi:LruC domain-containing protein
MVYTPVSDQVKVDKNFSFLDESSQPYIYDITTGKTVKLSKRGEDPHGIMIPKDFRWPVERVCIKNAYLQFNSWGENQVTSTDWYLHPEEDKVI